MKDNRTCVFFGGTGNLGYACVKTMLEKNMNVVLCTHDPIRSAQMMEEFASYPGTVIAINNDISFTDLYKNVHDRFGSVDVVISKTGGLRVPQSFEEIDPQVLDATLHQQITEVVMNIQAALPYLKQSNSGRIVLFSTVGALNGMKEENLIDSVAKGGVLSLTYALSKQLAPFGITANCIAFSGMIQDHEGHGLDNSNILQEIPAGRLGTSEDLAAAASYLVSEEAGFITGEVLRVAGGLK